MEVYPAQARLDPFWTSDASMMFVYSYPAFTWTSPDLKGEVQFILAGQLARTYVHRPDIAASGKVYISKLKGVEIPM
jgi:hypothetical protein